MVNIRQAANFRRTVAALCLLLAPLLFAAAELLAPDAPGDAATQLAAFAEHRALWVPETTVSSCGLRIFVNEAGESISSVDADVVVWGEGG